MFPNVMKRTYESLHIRKHRNNNTLKEQTQVKTNNYDLFKTLNLLKNVHSQHTI